MPKRYRLALFANTVSLPTGRKEAATDGWFYPKNQTEEDALKALGCDSEDLTNPIDVPAQSASGIGAAVSNATYDGSNRCTGFQLGSVVYTITGWGTSTITITGSDGSSRVVTLDGSGRILGAA